MNLRDLFAKRLAAELSRVMGRDHLRIWDKAGSSVGRWLGINDRLGLNGVFGLQACYADGTPKEDMTFFSNTVMLVYRTQILADALRDGIAAPTLYFLPIVGPFGSITISENDTMASHAGWAEATGYDEIRQVWTAAAPASQSIHNTASPAVITASGALTISGLGLVIGGTSAKGNTTGTLVAAGTLPGDADKVLAASETLNMTYTINS